MMTLKTEVKPHAWQSHIVHPSTKWYKSGVEHVWLCPYCGATSPAPEPPKGSCPKRSK